MAIVQDTAHRIDRAPVIFLGCSGAELGSLAAVGAMAGLLIGLVIAIATGQWMTVILSIVVCMVIGVYYGGKTVMRKKENKPEGYYGRIVLYWLARQGLNRRYHHRSGWWGIRR